MSSLLKLCLRDYLAARWWWLLLLGATLFFGLVPLYWSGGQAFMANGAFLAAGALAYTLCIDDMFKTEAAAASLPLARSTIVRGRYLLAGLLLLAAGAVFFAFGHILTQGSWLAPAGRAAIRPLLTVEGAAGFAAALSFLFALYLPFYFRSGLAKGSLAFFVSLLLLSLIVAGLDKLGVFAGFLGGDIGTVDFLKGAGPGIVALFGRMKAGLGTPIFCIGVGLAIAGVFALSLLLSVRFYERREL